MCMNKLYMVYKVVLCGPIKREILTELVNIVWILPFLKKTHETEPFFSRLNLDHYLPLLSDQNPPFTQYLYIMEDPLTVCNSSSFSVGRHFSEKHKGIGVHVNEEQIAAVASQWNLADEMPV
ncbi:hypothetical protein BYT27DRAFT_7217524, partial [Phlegmacium glaucopus]